MGIRAGVAGMAAAVVLLGGTSTAWACDAPAGLEGVSGRAGDSVTLALPGTEQGARYSISVDGAEVASGKDTDASPGTSASFQVPDLGAPPGTFAVVATVDAAGGCDGWSRSTSLEYIGRGAATPAMPPPAATAAPAPPAAGGTPRRGASRADQDRSGVKGVTKTLRSVTPSLRRVASAKRRAAKARKAKPRKRRKKARAKRRREDTSVFDVPARPAPPDVSGGGADLSGEEFPGLGYTVAWRLLVTAALAGLALMLLVGARTRKRRALNS